MAIAAKNVEERDSKQYDDTIIAEIEGIRKSAKGACEKKFLINKVYL